jgi:hypothetical protein
MSLRAFVEHHREESISEFAVFARTLTPSAAHMTEAELRDHAEEILTAVLEDMATEQTVQEQSRKPQSHGSAQIMKASRKPHADDWVQQGFTFQAVLAEFRAPRATVLRLYEQSANLT